MTLLPVGVPKELAVGERRVGLTPKGVAFLAKHSVPVWIEKQAGLASGFSDAQYERAGARMVKTGSELWQAAAVIKKVKEPLAQEFSLIQSHHIIFTFLHLASPVSPPLLEALLRSRATAIGYETVVVGGETSVLKSMSEVAGVLAAYFAGVFRNHVTVEGDQIKGREKTKEMMEQLALDYPAIPKDLNPGHVVVLGGGYVGRNAAQMGAQMGGRIDLSEISEERRSILAESFRAVGLRVDLLDPHDRNTYESHLSSCDVIVGAVHKSGRRAPIVIDSPLLEKISRHRKKVILDVSVDQGGNVAESIRSSYEAPLYLDSKGNLRFAVSNIPSLCGQAATVLLEDATLAYTLALSRGLDSLAARYPELLAAVNVRDGSLIHEGVREAHDLQ